jgi:hypothetical protein
VARNFGKSRLAASKCSHILDPSRHMSRRVERCSEPQRGLRHSPLRIARRSFLLRWTGRPLTYSAWHLNHTARAATLPSRNRHRKFERQWALRGQTCTGRSPRFAAATHSRRAQNTRLTTLSPNLPTKWRAIASLVNNTAVNDFSSQHWRQEQPHPSVSQRAVHACRRLVLTNDESNTVRAVQTNNPAAPIQRSKDDRREP